MPGDLRLESDWPDHPKTLGLIRRCGLDGPRCLLRLWCHAERRIWNGDLVGLTDEAIADAAGWPVTEPVERFIGALVELRWLDGEAGAYKLHDWAEHQPYIVTREERAAQFKALADRRWDKKRSACDTQSEPMRAASKSDARRNAPRSQIPELEQAAVAAVPVCEAHDTTADVETVPGEDASETGKGRNAGRKAEPRALSADKRIVLNQETWTLEGVTDEDRAALAAEFPLVDPDFACRDVAGYARVDATYRARKNWARTLRNRCRMLQDRAERGLDAGPRPRMSFGASAPTNEAKPAQPLAPLGMPSVDWRTVVEVLEARVGDGVSRWIRPLRYAGDRGEVLELVAPDEFHAGWVRDNLDERFRDVLLDVTGRHLGIRVVVDGGAAC